MIVCREPLQRKRTISKTSIDIVRFGNVGFSVCVNVLVSDVWSLVWMLRLTLLGEEQEQLKSSRKVDVSVFSDV